MGEIRSTLDIIMEKTKGLTMTEAEKREFREKETAAKVKGLILKFMDRSLTLQGLRVEMAALEEKDRNTVHRLVREEAVSRILPGKDNEKLLALLEDITPMDATRLRQALADFDKTLEQEREAREKTLLKRLHERGISGSAARPNMEADPKWISLVSKMGENLREKISSLAG